MVETYVARRASPGLRTAVFVLGGLETIALLAMLGMVISSGQLTSGEALSRSLAWAVLAIYGLPYLICVVPALVLAARNQRLKLALGLCMLGVPLVALAFKIA